MRHVAMVGRIWSIICIGSQWRCRIYCQLMSMSVSHTADLLSGARIVQQIRTQETWNTKLGHLVLQTLGEENRDTTFGLQDIPWDGERTEKSRDATMVPGGIETQQHRPQKGLKHSQRRPLSISEVLSLQSCKTTWSRSSCEVARIPRKIWNIFERTLTFRPEMHEAENGH